ncbi:MAG: hypothetical protein ACRDHX_05295 [Chloroflexota bacterium]
MAESGGRTFYQCPMGPEEARGFRAAPRLVGLAEEIALVRLRIRALAQAPEPGEELPLPRQALLLRAIDLLARLVRIQSQLQPDQQDLLGELNEAVLRKLEAEP